MQWLNPTFWLVLLIAAIVLFGSGYAAGHKAASSACALRESHAQQAAQSKADEITVQREQVAQQRETSREQIRVVYRTLKEQTNETPVNTDCGLDANGLRLWNAANAGAAEAVLGQPDYTLPSATARAIWPLGGLALQPHRIDGAIRAVPGPDEQVGGVQSRRGAVKPFGVEVQP